MLTQVFASAVFGIEAYPVTVEVHIDKGISYHLVGLPDNAVKESNFRIAAALNNCGFKLPGKKITINLAPADLRKESAAFDLPIAIGILAASEQIRSDCLDCCSIMGSGSRDIIPGLAALPICRKGGSCQIAVTGI